MLDASMRALIPELVALRDIGFSSTDNVTSDQTPTLTGSVRGRVSQVRIVIDGKPGALVPVENGHWHHTEPAEAAFAAGSHTIAVRPVDDSGTGGQLSRPIVVSIVTAAPIAPTIGLGTTSDTGVKRDGKTTFDSSMIRGVAQPGQQVEVSIDGVFAALVKADARSGAWAFQSPRLAVGVHEFTAVAKNRAGLRSAATSFQVTVNGERTVMLGGSDGNTVELMASHLLGRESQGFIVTQVQRGTLQRWSASRNAWITIPTKRLATDPASLQKAPAIRKLAFDEIVRWTPSRDDFGMAPAFSVVPMDTAGGRIAPTPEPGTVPGKLVNAQIGPLAGGVGQTITWDDPTDGCGCASTRYSIEVTREDGQTLIYSLPRSVHGVPIVEGGLVEQAKVWGATSNGAGLASRFDLKSTAEIAAKVGYTLTSSLSFIELGAKARSQLENSLTPRQFTTGLPLGRSHADLAYLQVDVVPNASEAARGLSASTPMIILSNSSELTPLQLTNLKANPSYASYLFPGTVNGIVQPDQVRVHYQGGETLRFSGTVDPRIRAGATIVVETAQNLGDGSLGPWFEEARIPISADGGYSHDYVVPYGLNSVRTRLEYRTQAAAPARQAAQASTVGATSTSSTQPLSTPIDLSNYFNAFAITTAPWQAPNDKGFDRNGNYYNSDYTGSGTSDPIPAPPISYNGITFPIGPIPTQDGQVGGSGNSWKHNPPNFVQARGQTITVSVDADMSDYLYLAGAASNGNQMSQKIILNFTDGTSEVWTQSFHDWASVGPPQQDATTQPNHALLPVMVVSTSSITASGTQTIDGVALAVGDRVLLQNQANAAQNGVYLVQNGPWTLAKDADTSAEILGSFAKVVSGTYAGKTFVNTNTGTINLEPVMHLSR